MTESTKTLQLPSGEHVFMLSEDYEKGEGPLMPTPTHCFDDPFGTSFAHVFENGKVLRFRQHICNFSDLKVIDE